MLCVLVLCALLCTSTQCVDFLVMQCDTQEAAHSYAEGKCSASDSDEVQKQTEAFNCTQEPRDALVKLTADMPDAQYLPSSVVVKRCGGFCPGNLNLACKPKPGETKIKQICVQRKQDNKISTVTVEVEEHVACQCDCAVENTCKENQKFEECRCKCLNEADIPGCYASGKHRWNPDSCECECVDPLECGSMHEWSSTMCECVLKEENVV